MPEGLTKMAFASLLPPPEVADPHPLPALGPGEGLAQGRDRVGPTVPHGAWASVEGEWEEEAAGAVGKVGLGGGVEEVELGFVVAPLPLLRLAVLR